MRKGDRAGLGRAAGREAAGKEGLGDAQPSDLSDKDDGPFCGHRGRKRQLWGGDSELSCGATDGTWLG